jgi:hypothetical protein
LPVSRKVADNPAERFGTAVLEELNDTELALLSVFRKGFAGTGKNGEHALEPGTIGRRAEAAFQLLIGGDPNSHIAHLDSVIEGLLAGNSAFFQLNHLTESISPVHNRIAYTEDHDCLLIMGGGYK